ncbi:hypothetical protein [Mariniblastus fucicola]|uniref:Uncharacterized protein n=1 Tax=Mariniblastus fucicola TaxID=980251 RepID=A0A5B9P8P9_9BACT|nr:hypothetical protein [Mariniblastus fucicola]QEG22734.1 hypothetical protein MFFC18_26170 [Mariniblastus fucicola]
MSIRVTCGKCHTRFNVSEKFAGKEGPCPKCKTKIKIPAKSEQVVVHEPEMSGPKTTTGESVLKPIRRKEVKLTSIHITVIVCLIVLFLICALVFNFTFADKHAFPGWVLWVSAIVIAPPICLAGYFMLRDQELGGYVGKELWIRILVCSAIYALLWIAMPLGKYAFGDSYGTGSWVFALVIMAGGGAAAGMLSFDVDYLMGLVHYGLYLVLCIVGRLVAGIGILPGALGKPEVVPPETVTTAMVVAEPILSGLMALFG